MSVDAIVNAANTSLLDRAGGMVQASGTGASRILLSDIFDRKHFSKIRSDKFYAANVNIKM